MKKIIGILLLIISTSAYSQTDHCSICDSLDKMSAREKNGYYYLKCVQRDSVVLNDSVYEVKRIYACKDKITLTKYLYNSDNPFFTREIFGGKDTVYFQPDKIAEYTGGRGAMVKYITQSVKYPKTALRKGIQGRVLVSFYISKTGKLYGAKVAEETSPDLDEEALRIIQEMPDWIPAEYGDRLVASKLSLPIKFTLP